MPAKNKRLRLPKTLKWTVEFTVDASWVRDGFDLTNERAKDMLAGDLTLAHDSELAAKVLSAPDAEIIKRLQGGE